MTLFSSYEQEFFFSNWIKKKDVSPCASHFSKNSIEDAVEIFPRVMAFNDTYAISVKPAVSLFTILPENLAWN